MQTSTNWHKLTNIGIIWDTTCFSKICGILYRKSIICFYRKAELFILTHESYNEPAHVEVNWSRGYKKLAKKKYPMK